jgi:hypothetical protein
MPALTAGFLAGLGPGRSRWSAQGRAEFFERIGRRMGRF